MAALDYRFQCDGVEAFKLGTGKGVLFLEMVTKFEKVSGQTIP